MNRNLVIIPTLNEVGNIGILIASLLKKTNLDILVVDDGSNDGTVDEVNKFKVTKRVFLLSRSKSVGRKGAIIYGMKWALSHAHFWHNFIEMDADFSHNPRYIESLIQQMPKYSIAIGSRYTYGGNFDSLSFIRRRASQLVNFLFSFVCCLKFSDISGGFRCYTRGAIQNLIQHAFISNGFIANIETLAILVKEYNSSVVEIPITFDKRRYGQSKFSSREITDTFKYFLHLVFSQLKTMTKKPAINGV